MTEDANLNSADLSPDILPYEVIPELAANTRFIELSTELQKMKDLKALYFDDRKDAKGKKLPSRWDATKAEVAAMARAAGMKSVAFDRISVMTVAGGETRGRITGAGIVSAAAEEDLTPQIMRAIVLASRDVDPQIAVDHGVPPMLLEAGREPGKPRASSIRVEIIGG